MRLASVLVLAIATAHVHGLKDTFQDPGCTAALLAGLDRLVDLLNPLKIQAATPENNQRLNRVSELIQSVQFHLMNGRTFEKSPRELLMKLAAEIRMASPQQVGNEFAETLDKLRAEATGAWEASDSTAVDECLNETPSAPELVLSELTNRCTKGSDHYDVMGCVGAATLYCHRVFPQKSDSQLLGLITDRKGNALTVACLDRSGLVFSPDGNAFGQHCRHGCQQHGADRVCELHHGSEYAGIFADRVSLKMLGENAENSFMAGCFRATKRIQVEYSKLQTAENKECRAGNPVRHYGCLKGASSYCRDHFGYTGGVVQFWHTHEVAEVACYNAFYTGEVYISRDNDFLEAKGSLKKICSLDFEVDKGKILQATPEILTSGVYDNRRSSVELRDIFRVSKSATTENQFSHSHSMSIGVELVTKIKIPFIGESKIKISASYTATVSLTKTNSQTTQFEHTSEVFVPPGHGVVKKAVITRTKMDVPWRAIGISGLGKRVELSGTWIGVDVSDIRTEQVDL